MGMAPCMRYNNPMRPKLSVIVPAKNEQKLLPRCLGSLVRQQTNVPYEIIVVDGKSTDRTKEIARSFGVRVYTQKKSGKVYGFIEGAARARGEILCFTEADCVVPPHWIQTIADCFCSYPEIVAVSGIYSLHNSTPVYNTLAALSHAAGRFFYYLLYRSVSLRGSNFAIRRPVFRTIGGFSAVHYELYDVELGLRAAKKGRIRHLDRMKIQTSDRRFRGRIGTFLREFLQSFTRNILLNRPIPRQTYPDIR